MIPFSLSLIVIFPKILIFITLKKHHKKTSQYILCRLNYITLHFSCSKFSTYTSKSYYKIIESRIKAFHRVDLRLPMSFSAIMLTWEGQVGYPVLTVTRNYNSDQETVSVSQVRFLRNNVNLFKNVKFVDSFLVSQIKLCLGNSNKLLFATLSIF